MNVDLVSLPADGRAAGLARRVVRERLQSWHLEDLLDAAVLLTSEVVANVIVHTNSAPALGLSRDGAGVRVTVVDESPVPPLRRRHSSTATTGRGLQLLQDLADDWGWDRVRSGKAVWFVLRGGHDPWADGHHHAAPAPAPIPGAAPSPLGRYAPAPDTAGLVTVELLGLPVRVLAAAREHHDDLMREFRLLALAGPPTGDGVPARLVELTRTLGVRFGGASARPDEEVDRALESGVDTVDLAYRVPPTIVAGAVQLEALMSEADEFCRSAQLITLARTPVVARFGRWYLAQFVDQIRATRPPAGTARSTRSALPGGVRLRSSGRVASTRQVAPAGWVCTSSQRSRSRRSEPVSPSGSVASRREPSCVPATSRTASTSFAPTSTGRCPDSTCSAARIVVSSAGSTSAVPTTRPSCSTSTRRLSCLAIRAPPGSEGCTSVTGRTRHHDVGAGKRVTGRWRRSPVIGTARRHYAERGRGRDRPDAGGARGRGRRCLRGGEDAILELLPVVRRVVAARIRDPHLVDDLVQETLARMMGARARLEPDALVPYAIVTARNLVASHAAAAGPGPAQGAPARRPGRPADPGGRGAGRGAPVAARRGAAAAARAGAGPAARARGRGDRHRDAGRRPRLDPGRDRRPAVSRSRAKLRVEYLLAQAGASRRPTGAGRCCSRCPAASAGASGSSTAPVTCWNATTASG